MTIIEISVSGAAMILVITLIRAVFIHKLPKKAFVLMWEIAILRLLLPIRIPAVTSVFNLSERMIPRESIYAKPLPEPNFAVNGDGYLEIAQAATTFDVPVWEIVRIVGSVILAAVFIGLYVLSFGRYRFAERVNIVLPEELRLRRKVEIRVCGGISSPLTYGLVKPVILLPKTFELGNPEKLKFVLTHELTHIKRFDILRKIAAIIAVCVHWFNPLAWVMFVLFNRDIELVCDDAVIGKIGRENRKKYAMALIEMLDNSSGILHNYFSKNAIEERITAISRHRKKSVLSGIAAGVLALCVTAVFATSAASPYKKIDDIAGFERIFDSPMKSVTLKSTSDNTFFLRVSAGQPFADKWKTFLSNAELLEINENTPENSDIVVVTTTEGEFTIFTDGRTLTLGNQTYIFNSDLPIPLDKALYPFHTEDNILI